MNYTSDSGGRAGPAARERSKSRLLATLDDLRDGWAAHSIAPWPIPLVPSDSAQPRRNWLPEPEWLSGWSTFEIFRLQTEPNLWAPPIARICKVICDQFDREDAGLNYAMDRLPPRHHLLDDFALGSNQWFRALYSILTYREIDAVEGWEELVSELYNWIGPDDSLRLRAKDVYHDALTLDWAWHEYSLPEAKQDPVWSFPKALAWIAMRDYLALARVGSFRRPTDEDEAVAEDGVCKYNTEALGWLHTAISYSRCECGALASFGWEAFRQCTCISVAWEELVRFNGGLEASTPELVFNIQEGWLSMTWPEGADQIRFLRRDILDRWPPRPLEKPEPFGADHSTTSGERECRDWLAVEFAADPEKRRSKGDFRKAALAAFPGRLSERGFNLRVWPDLARDNGRDGAGAKKKS